MRRTLSFTEISTALTCQARWDFAYGDQLAGSSLRRRQIAARLSDGRAWGAAVAAWHAHRGPETLEAVYDPATGRYAAHAALTASYAADIAEQANADVRVDPEHEVDRIYRLHEILEHYMATAVKFENLTQLEGRFETPLPSRGGLHRSTRYWFEGFIDGYTVLEIDGSEWIVEFKLRDALTPRKYLVLGRQHLWYAWARAVISGHPVVGCIIDERLNRAPEPPIINMDGRPSIKKDQYTTAELYLEACKDADCEPNQATVSALAARRWQQREPILFRPNQLLEAGRELVAAGQLVADLERRDRYPIRNGLKHICSGCRYSEVCPNPQDDLFVDAQFERVPPKRERPKEVDVVGVS